MELIETDSLVNQDISSPLLISSYTADESRLLLIQVYLGDIAGDDIYKMCITKQDGGAGTMYQSPTSFSTVELGTTTVYLLSEIIPVEENDVIRVYAEGTALDTEINTETKMFDINYDSSFESISEEIQAIDNEGIANAVWSNSTRTLTFSPQNLASITDGDSLSLIRGDTFIYEFTGIEMELYEESFFTIKEHYKDADTAALIQLSSASGLLYLNGEEQTAASSTALGEITSGSASLTVKIQANATKELDYSTDNYFYDVQTKVSGSIVTPYIGEIAVVRDTTKRIT